MMKVINEAYSRIAHAPMRYHIESYPAIQERRNQKASSRPVDAEPTGRVDRDTLPVTDRFEFWVRFVFGAMFGGFVSFSLFLDLFKYPHVLTAITLGLIVGCGLAATRWGEKFWQIMLKCWWLWS